ncbi:hypothetical protein BDR07DRAFT_1445077, partial [Suillus spraguei]
MGGKTAQATIMDKCMGCPYGGLDLSTGLFNYFASESAGVLYGSWSFEDVASKPTPSTSSNGLAPTLVPRADWSTPTTPPTQTPLPLLYLHLNQHYIYKRNSLIDTSTISTHSSSMTSRFTAFMMARG